mgnify:FL=1
MNKFAQLKKACIFVPTITLKTNTMTTLKNTKGTKAVNIRTNEYSTTAMYVQIYNGEEQVLDSKTYATEKRALKWAKQKLELI